MKNVVTEFITISLISITVFVVFNKGISFLLKYLYGLVINKGDELFKEIDKDKNIAAKKTDDVKDELDNLKILESKRQLAGFLTKMICFIEFALIAFTTCLAFVEIFPREKRLLETFTPIMFVIAGWLAIKIFGNYQQWSGIVFGRSTYYIFLTGTVLNIVLSILIGVCISYFI